MGYDKRIAEVMIARYNNGVKSIGIDSLDKNYNSNEMVRERIDVAAQKLSGLSFITVEYNLDDSTKIKRLVIDEDRAVDFAAQYGMKTKEILVREVNEMLSQYDENPNKLMRSFINQQRKSIAKNRAISFVNKQSANGLKEVLMALDAITTQTEDISMYALSDKVFGDKQKIGEIIVNLKKVISNDYESETDFLHEHHVFADPTFAVTKGHGKLIDKNGKSIEISDYIGTIKMTYDFVSTLDSVEAGKIVIVESQESFDKFNIDGFDGLVMYLNSFSNETNVCFLQKTNATIYYHGDLDARTIRIIRNLIDRVEKPIVNPLLSMSMYDKYKGQGKKMNEFNKRCLKRMMFDTRYTPQSREIIEKMLSENIIVKHTVVDANSLY